MKSKVRAGIDSSLIIVDMQADFAPTATKAITVKNVNREVRKAIKNEWLIVVVLFRNNGILLPQVKKAIGKYANVVEVTKRQDDGSKNITNKVVFRALKHIRVVGVNICYCVHDTAEGLQKRLPKSNVTIVMDACNCPDHGRSKGHFVPKNGVNIEKRGKVQKQGGGRCKTI